MIESEGTTIARNGRSLRRTVNVAALLVAAAVTMSMPLVYGLIVYKYEDTIGQFRARLYANRVSAFAEKYPEVWQNDKRRLLPLIESEFFRGLTHSRILDAEGQLIVAEATLSGRFHLVRSHPIVVADETLGIVENSRPMDRLLEEIGLVALFSLLLGLLTYLAIRIYPLRVIDRTLHDLAGADRVIQEKNIALQAQNSALRERESALRYTEAKLKQRSGQLLEAQQLGKIGDWSYRLGDSHVIWAPEIFELLGYSQTGFETTHAAVVSVYDGDDAQRVLQSQSEVMRTRKAKSIDVKARRADGSIGDFAVTSKAMTDADDRVIGFVGTIQDISDRKSAEEKLEQLAYYDPLTGLGNRALFRRQIGDVIARCTHHGQEAALLLIDLDRFKEVNDSLGHNAGDVLLSKVADLITITVGSGHFVARLGGDEFAIIVTESSDQDSVGALAGQVIEALSHPILLDRIEVNIGASIGIATFPSNGSYTNDLLRNADLALYRAKEDGRGRFHFFTPEMSDAVQHKMAMSRDLRAAITENSGLSVHYQPQVDLKTRRVTGFEALMRWNHPTLGNVPPSIFIPIAESSNLICDLGVWILRESARQAKAWLDAGEQPRQIAVNVSAAQIWHTDFVTEVISVLQETALPPHLLCLELTESLLADHAEGRVRNVLMELKRLGVTLALDDFGTDYSSLGYLTRLPFDKLKIDRIFVDGIASSTRARKLLEGVIALGRGLGMTIVMEGVEREDEVEILRGFNCDMIQGYVFARPTPAAQALAFAHGFDHRPAPAAPSIVPAQAEVA